MSNVLPAGGGDGRQYANSPHTHRSHHSAGAVQKYPWLGSLPQG